MPCRRPARSTISSSRPPTPRTISTPARPSRPGMAACASTSARPARCGRRAKPPARRRSNAPSTRRPWPAASTRWSSACATMPRPTRHPASRSRPRRCANATPRAPSASAGPDGRWRRARCATTRAASSAGAWARAMFQCPMFPAEARATLRTDGTALVETAGADMGQGAWTALAQIAADGLGLDVERSRVPLRHLRPARRRRRRRLGPHRHGGHGAPQCRHRRHRKAGRNRHGRSAVAALRRRQCRGRGA